jgi:hypothetical protein
MALDYDHPIHQKLLRISQWLGNPWPPDPYLGSLARLTFLRSRVPLEVARLERLVRRLELIKKVHDRVHAQTVQALADLNEILDAYEYVARDCARERDGCAWLAPSQRRRKDSR